MEITVKQLTCLRCGHQWYPRIRKDGTVRRPTLCASCNSPYWSKPREVRT